MTHRRMADPVFRAEQRAALHDARTAPITTFVDDLRAGGRWAPYVAPLHGGVDARVLSILRDPGPMTADAGGSGMLCVENDDPTAEMQATMFDAAGIDPAEVIPWNAYPWYINRKPNAGEMREGGRVIADLSALLPRLAVVLLQGRDAQRGWGIATALDLGLASRPLNVVATYHPGRQALFHPDPAERARRAADRRGAIAMVGHLLHR